MRESRADTNLAAANYTVANCAVPYLPASDRAVPGAIVYKIDRGQHV